MVTYLLRQLSIGGFAERVTHKRQLCIDATLQLCMLCCLHIKSSFQYGDFSF